MLREERPTANNSFSLALSYRGNQVRMVGTNEYPEWVAVDVCRAIGLRNPSRYLRAFPENHKGITRIYTPGGPQNLLTVNEAGLYRLIFRSDKPEAEAFRSWVFEEVLPAIRKHGQYPPPAEGYQTDLFTTNHHAIAQLASVVAELAERVDAIGTRKGDAFNATPSASLNPTPRVSVETILSAWGESKPLGQWAADPRCQVTPHGLVHRIAQGWAHDLAIAKLPRGEYKPRDGRQRILKLRG